MVNYKLKHIIILLVITVVSANGVEAFNRIEAQPTADMEEFKEPALQSEIKDEQPKIDISVITRRNLFASKEEEKEPEKEIAPLNDVKATSLAVALMGTVTGVENDHRAIIYDKKERKQEMYQEGDHLQGAIIRQITRGKVIITVNGRNELLDIAEARNVNVPQVQKPGAVTTAQRVVGRPAGGMSGADLAASSNTVNLQSGVSPANPNAARARQIRAYRSRALPAKTDTAMQ